MGCNRDRRSEKTRGMFHNLTKRPQNGYKQLKLDVEVERKELMTKRPPRIDATQIGSKKIKFQLEMKKRFETLQEQDDINTMSETITNMVIQSASRVAKAINKQQKWRISSPTRVLMTKRREMVENGDNKQRIRRNMQDYQNESKRVHQEIQPRDHTRNDHDIKEPDESVKNAEARPVQTDHTPRQAG